MPNSPVVPFSPCCFRVSLLKLNIRIKRTLITGEPGTQRVHVGIWYILRAQRGSHIPTLRPKYIPYYYMDPLGNGW